MQLAGRVDAISSGSGCHDMKVLGGDDKLSFVSLNGNASVSNLRDRQFHLSEPVGDCLRTLGRTERVISFVPDGCRGTFTRSDLVDDVNEQMELLLERGTAAFTLRMQKYDL